MRQRPGGEAFILPPLVAISLLLASVAGMADDKAATRDALRQMRKETLDQLYKEWRDPDLNAK